MNVQRLIRTTSPHIHRHHPLQARVLMTAEGRRFGFSPEARPTLLARYGTQNLARFGDAVGDTAAPAHPAQFSVGRLYATTADTNTRLAPLASDSRVAAGAIQVGG